MLNAQINQVKQSFEADKESRELGLEGFGSFTDYLGSFVKSWSGLQHKLVPDMVVKKVPNTLSSSLIKKISRTDMKGLSKITVYKPIGFDNQMTPYAKYVASVMTSLVDIEKRLYLPLINYLSVNMSDITHPDAPWLDKSIKFINSKVVIKTLGGFINKKANRGEGSTMAPFGELYISPKDFIVTGEYIRELKDLATGFNLKSLQDNEAKLYELMQLYIKTAKENPEMIPTNRQTIRKLADTLKAIAIETELLATVFYINTSLTQLYKDSADKLDSNL